MAPPKQVAQFRTATIDLSTVAFGEVRRLLSSVDNVNPLIVRDALLELMPELLGPYVSASGELAGAFYESLRADVLEGVFYADALTSIAPDRVESLVRYSVKPLFGQSDASVLSLLSGGVQRIIANAGRETVAVNGRRDTSFVGFQRVPAPGACAFCAMVASRGAVYGSARSAGEGNRYHDFCRCVAAPVFKGDSWSSDLAGTYTDRYTGIGGSGEPDAALLSALRARYSLN